MIFRFQNPSAFYLLLFIPLLFLLRKLKLFSKITFPAVLADWKGSSFRWHAKIRTFVSFLTGFMGLSAAVIVIAAFADPVVTRQEKVYTSLGTDVMFVIDTSPSMAAKDFDGDNRLSCAKKTITELLQEQGGFQYGAVLLGSEAAVYIPATSDINAFTKRLDEVNVGLQGDGSAIGDGLCTAIYHLSASKAPKKCIVLLTDGENNSGEIHPETAATLANLNNIKIYVVGIGTKGAVPIEYTDPVTGKQYSGYLDSNFDSASLQKIAGIAKGRYFEAKTSKELLNTLQTVAKAEGVNQNFNYRNNDELYYDKFLMLGIFLFMVAWFFKRVLLNETI